MQRQITENEYHDVQLEQNKITCRKDGAYFEFVKNSINSPEKKKGSPISVIAFNASGLAHRFSGLIESKDDIILRTKGMYDSIDELFDDLVASIQGENDIIQFRIASANMLEFKVEFHIGKRKKIRVFHFEITAEIIRDVDELLLQIEDQAREINDLKKKNNDLMTKMVTKSREVDTLKKSFNEGGFNRSRNVSPYQKSKDNSFGYSPFTQGPGIGDSQQLFEHSNYLNQTINDPIISTRRRNSINRQPITTANSINEQKVNLSAIKLSSPPTLPEYSFDMSNVFAPYLRFSNKNRTVRNSDQDGYRMAIAIPPIKRHGQTIFNLKLATEKFGVYIGICSDQYKNDLELEYAHGQESSYCVYLNSDGQCGIYNSTKYKALAGQDDMGGTIVKVCIDMDKNEITYYRDGMTLIGQSQISEEDSGIKFIPFVDLSYNNVVSFV